MPSLRQEMTPVLRPGSRLPWHGRTGKAGGPSLALAHPGRRHQSPGSPGRDARSAESAMGRQLLAVCVTG
jgi:hypothetical protein